MTSALRLLLCLIVAPIASSSGFVPVAPSKCTAATPTGFRRMPTSPVCRGRNARTSMALASSGGDVSTQEVANAASYSRASFLHQAFGLVALTAVALELGVDPGYADSTGKYSTKATARKRYLPRITKLVSAFRRLKEELADGSATAASAFFVDVLGDGVPAMDLFGSSMKRGEYPDSTSRGLQQSAQDFSAACKGIATSLAKGGGAAEASKNYDKAYAILADYLEKTKLDPIGSDIYN